MYNTFDKLEQIVATIVLLAMLFVFVKHGLSAKELLAFILMMGGSIVIIVSLLKIWTHGSK